MDRQLQLKSKSIERLCKDLKNYNTDLEGYTAIRNDPNTTEQASYINEKQIIETTKVIDAVQTDISQTVDKLEELIKDFQAANNNDLALCDENQAYSAAKVIYLGLTDLGMEVDSGLFVPPQ